MQVLIRKERPDGLLRCILPCEIAITINYQQLTHTELMCESRGHTLASKVQKCQCQCRGCESIKVFCARWVRCDGSSLDSVLKIIPDARGRTVQCTGTGRVSLQNQASTLCLSERSAWPASLPAQPAQSAQSARCGSTHGLHWPHSTLAHTRGLWLIIRGC